MNRSGDSPTVNVQISAPDGRLDAALVGRLAQAILGALSGHDRPRRGPATASQSSAPPAETAA